MCVDGWWCLVRRNGFLWCCDSIKTISDEEKMPKVYVVYTLHYNFNYIAIR